MSQRPPVTNLEQLNDTSIASPTNGQLLIFISATSKWTNGPAPVPTLSDLSDVAVVSTASNQVLRWDATSSKWVNYGPLTFNDIGGSVITQQVVTVATSASLPLSPFPGQLSYVSDGAASLAWGATVTGGGSTKYLVWFNGTDWTVIGK